MAKILFNLLGLRKVYKSIEAKDNNQSPKAKNLLHFSKEGEEIMRKIKSIALSTGLVAALAASPVFAEGPEISGHVTANAGFQQDDGSTVDLGSCSFGLGGLGCNSIDTIGSGVGGLGGFRGLGNPNRTTFNFYLDEVEIDVQKSFGENIRLRADIDFGRLLSGTTDLNASAANSIVEQGYVTANIPVGNGMEFLVGRFNAPIGYESVDRIDNVAISYSSIFRYVRPHNLTGAKFYYAFNDNVDLNVYVVNNLADTFSFGSGSDSAIPSWGTRLGFTWGEEGHENTLGISYAGGPENFGHNAHLTHMFDLDFTLWFSENLMLAGEGIYRMDNTNFVDSQGRDFNGLPNSKVLAGNLLLNWVASDAWNLFFRYGYIHDINPTGAYTGLDQQIHDFTLGFGYNITDDANLKMEYRLDMRNYSTAVANALTGGDQSSISHALLMQMGYRF
ncbi:MAG: outer membrane beta-barrel protein [Deltaproteobacteria bacterium]|nr:outer membrane beta-barrel protein [Deltaproteobacteria bacterium]